MNLGAFKIQLPVFGPLPSQLISVTTTFDGADGLLFFTVNGD